MKVPLENKPEWGMGAEEVGQGASPPVQLRSCGFLYGAGQRVQACLEFQACDASVEVRKVPRWGIARRFACCPRRLERRFSDG